MAERELNRTGTFRLILEAQGSLMIFCHVTFISNLLRMTDPVLKIERVLCKEVEAHNCTPDVQVIYCGTQTHMGV